MMRYNRLAPQFIENLPEALTPGILYVSIAYGTVAHSCCCGCGEEVVTPLGPTDWRMTYDGENISLRPSVGSWTLPCKSHYLIEGGRVIKAGQWSDRQIEAERQRDRAAKARHYGQGPVATAKGPTTATPAQAGVTKESFWRWVWRRLAS